MSAKDTARTLLGAPGGGSVNNLLPRQFTASLAPAQRPSGGCHG